MNTHSIRSLAYSACRIGAAAFIGMIFLVGGHSTALAASLPSSSLASVPVASSPIIHAAQSPQEPNSGISPNLSRNWSGYVAEDTSPQNTNSYSSVTGTWIIPTVQATQSAAADATWVGIGGMTSTDLIQAGTQAITQNGQVLYQAWYEVLPNASIPLTLAVKPGDSITTTLTNQGNNNWLITIVDNTTGQQYQTTVNYDSSESSAEWIEEMPATTEGYIALDNFGSVPFTQATAVMNGVSENLTELGAQPLTMTTGMQTLASPSSIGSDNESFTVSRTTASSDITPEIIPLSRSGFIREPHGDQGFSYASSTTQSDGNGGEITRYVRYFVIPVGAEGTTTNVSGGDGQTFQYSVGNGGFTFQFSF